MTASLLARVEMAPRDPILGLTEQFVADRNPGKVNLGVGVYHDDAGRLPLLECVKEAEKRALAQAKAKGYLPIDGLAAYDTAVKALVFGADAEAVRADRVATVQAVGGTGGLKIGADFLQRLAPSATVRISDPSWENHRALFEGAGFRVETYPYYDPTSRGLRFEAMCEALDKAPAGDIVVLHACCHNPTGVDIAPAQWQAVAGILAARGTVPFLDMAYQGFGDGIDADSHAVRVFLAAGLQFLVSSSFSKSFSLYGERVGALSVVAASKEERERVLSQLKRVIRTNYSNPPTHGAAIVASVLATPDLRALWEQELTGMRERIRRMRHGLVERLKARGITRDLSFWTTQRGMFSYSGLSPEQVDRLREQFGIYVLRSGRICVAALNEANLDYVADGIAAVMRE